MRKKKPSPQKNWPTLDLHGFKVGDVDAALDRFIYQHSQKGTARVRVMPGKGTGAVKSQVTSYLKQANYPWQYEKLSNGKPNEGVMIVFVND